LLTRLWKSAMLTRLTSFSAQVPIRLFGSVGEGRSGSLSPLRRPAATLSPTTPTFSLSTLHMDESDKRNVTQQPSSNSPGAPPPPPCCFSSRRPFRDNPWEDYRPCLDLFVHLHGSSNRSRRRSRRAATGAIRTWIPYLWTSEHGPCSTTLRTGFQTLRTLPRGHLPHQCSP
jgi:hypothetical protein